LTQVAETEARAYGLDTPADHKPLVEIRAHRSRLSLAELRELWDFREVLWAFVVRFVKVKYKQAVIGVGWAVVQPILSAALFALVLGHFARVSSGGPPYLLFALAGMTAWTYFSTALTQAAFSLVTDQGLLRKVYFPREVIPLAGVGAALVDFVPALVTLMVVALLYGVLPAASWLLLPVPAILLVISATAFGLGTSALNVYYRDIKHALPFVLQLGLFASTVVYPLSVIPSPWRTIYAIANPVVGAIDGIRAIVIDGDLPDLAITSGALGWSILLLLGNYVFFKRLERSFADRV
jgi:lipopolysaccharide transport system permease protein